MFLVFAFIVLLCIDLQNLYTLYRLFGEQYTKNYMESAEYIAPRVVLVIGLILIRIFLR